MAQQIISSNTFCATRWIVSSDASQGTHTTIAAALTSASAGDTIVLRPGTYTENITLKDRVNISGMPGDGDTPNVIINGTVSASGLVTSVISYVQLQTNSANLLSVTGSSATIIYINFCNLVCSNNTAINYTTTSTSAIVTLKNCRGNVSSATNIFFTHSGTGSLFISNCIFTNSGASTGVSTLSSGGSLYIQNSNLTFPITTSSTSVFDMSNSVVDTSALNLTALTLGGSGAQSVQTSCLLSGTASAISIGSTATISNCALDSSNTNCITGAGTINYAGLSFANSSTINTTTTTRKVTDGGQYQGRNVNTAPSASMLGEEIRSAIASGSAVSLTTATAANVTSISLTAGIWDVSGLVMFTGTPTGGTPYFSASINTTSATQGTLGDNAATSQTPPISGADNALVVPTYRISLNSTTTTYLVARADFSSGTCSAYGRISSTRVS